MYDKIHYKLKKKKKKKKELLKEKKKIQFIKVKAPRWHLWLRTRLSRDARDAGLIPALGWENPLE